MTDRRMLAANAHVAHESLRGKHSAPRFAAGHTLRCCKPFTDLCAHPDGARDKQILFGHAFQVLDVRDGWAFGFDVADSYVGYVRTEALQEMWPPTHRVCVRASHVYSAPDIKAFDLHPLSFGSELSIGGISGPFAALVGGGYVPAAHIAPLSAVSRDPVETAKIFLGTPYLWGGDTASGLDCSALVQVSLRAAALPCPRDSDQQATLWQDVPGIESLRRGDLVFWKGHVAIAVDGSTLIHANAHDMAVAFEPLGQAISRIAEQGGGQLTTIRRPPFGSA